MAKRTKKTPESFLSRFSLKKSALMLPDRKVGRPGLREGVDASGRRIFLKFWPREKGVDDTDLEDIWRSEIRQLHRLAAVPGADDLIAKMTSSGSDESGFYLVLDAGETAPLASLIANGASVVLNTSRQPQSRYLLWRNFRRLVTAVDLLHSQGVIHRNLDTWCILTNLRSIPDFALTGFEWSMRISTAGSEKGRGSARAVRQRPATSFAGDWADLAFLFAAILDIPMDRLTNMQLVPSAVVEHSSAQEIRLLRIMLGLLPADRLNADELLRHVSSITLALGDEISGFETRYYASLALGNGSRLTQKIREQTDYSIEVDEISDQIEFIINDLGPAPLLIGYNNEIGGALSYALCGTLLNYRLRPYKRRASAEPESWEFASIDDADKSPPQPLSIKSSKPIDMSELDFSEQQQAFNAFPKLRGRTLSWEALIGPSAPVMGQKSPGQQLHKALSLLLRLEMAFATTEIYPVRVLTRPEQSPHGDRYRIEVADEADSDRNALAEALKINAPAVRLQKALSPEGPSENIKQDVEWALMDVGSLGTRGNVTKWRVATVPSAESEGIFSLEGQQPPQLTGRAFLTPAATAANLVQLRRRQRALTALLSHTELLQLLADQRGTVSDSQDKFAKDASYERFDDSKKKALEEITATVPLFMVQGPPGVGKTFLVTEIVRRKLRDEPVSRILLSAQSNAAIDHLMKEVADLFPTPGGPIMVRARAADDDAEAGRLEVSAQATDILRDLSQSKLCQPNNSLTARIRAMAGVQAVQAGGARSVAVSDRRMFESMLLRSANIVFATTNSPALETLIDERSLFDWSIIEEAAKASGTDLIQPLLLSYRRLLIGDHQQLPPFDLARFRGLLADPAAVQKTIQSSKKLIARYLKDVTIDEFAEDDEKAESALPKHCSDALSMLTMFETFVEGEYKRIERRPDRRRIARRLNEQHRMHPAIARIVSEAFYKKELITFEPKRAEFLSLRPPITLAAELAIPDSPVVWIDIPYSRRSPPGTYYGESERPFRSNLSEIETCQHVIAALRYAGTLSKPPTLAILSPYSAQVQKLRAAVGAKNIAALGETFRPEEGGDFFGTVDSFQGREADCVVISLVRNNEHTSYIKALGFLAESNRMNVLFSRAKHKLIIVGSMDFLDHVLSSPSNRSLESLQFFRTLLASVKDGRTRKIVDSNPTAEVSIVSHDKFN